MRDGVAAVRETGKQIYSPVDWRLSTASGRVITFAILVGEDSWTRKARIL